MSDIGCCIAARDPAEAGFSYGPPVVIPEPSAGGSARRLRQFAVALARSLGRGQVDPEDLAQEVLERWLHHHHRAAAIANPEAWISVVLRRLLVDRLRRRRAAAEVSVDCGALTAAEPEPEPESAPWWHELEVETVRQELGRLRPALREAFERFTFGRRSYQQIARELNIAPATVGSRISRARAELKRRLIERRAMLPSPSGGPGPATARELAHG